MLKRRLITIPAVWVATSLLTASVPILLVLAAIGDLARKSFTFASVRVVLFGLFFGWTECLGTLFLGAIGVWTIGRPTARLELTFAVQRLYTASLFHSARILLSLRFEVEGDGLIDDGPLLVLVRHASIVDTLLPGVFLSGKHGLRLRYVLKRELQWGPCLDIAGHWLPNHFASRDGADSEREIQKVAALKQGLQRGEGVILYPEGTRFSAKKRLRAIEKVDPALRERASKLRHVMPPRLGGTLALLDAAPACDVLVLAHHGLAGFSSIRDIWMGKLTGTTVRLNYFRIPAAQIPAGREERISFLYGAWEQIDGWLARVTA